MSGQESEFFIGWEASPPRGIGAHLRKVAALLLLLSGGVAALLAVSHSAAAPSRFEFGVERTFEGTLHHAPYPMLLVDRPGGGQSTWLLTVFGKVGAESATEPLDGHRVRLTGSLIHRGAHTMVELLPDSIEDLGVSDVPLVEDELGAVTLAGEIVDSKCFLGVMKPGSLKTHRACAVRCISGGVPPVLLVRTPGEVPRYVLLAGPAGESFGHRLLEFVAEPVAVEGELHSVAGYEVLYVSGRGVTRR